MTHERLLTLIESYGADPLGWPEDERAAAEHLLAAEPERFASALDAARSIDQALLARSEVVVPAGLAERIIASAPKAPEAKLSFLHRLKEWILPDGQLWPAAITAASLMIGVFAGYGVAGSPGASPTTQADEAFYTAFDTDYTVNFEEIAQ